MYFDAYFELEPVDCQEKTHWILFGFGGNRKSKVNQQLFEKSIEIGWKKCISFCSSATMKEHYQNVRKKIGSMSNSEE